MQAVIDFALRAQNDSFDVVSELTAHVSVLKDFLNDFQALFVVVLDEVQKYQPVFVLLLAVFIHINPYKWKEADEEGAGQ